MQTRWRNAAFIAAVLLVAAMGTAAAARSGAPEYVSSEPEDGAKLHEPPEQVSVTFSEPLDPGSTLVVLDECGKNVDNGEVDVFANEMTVGLERGPSGRYVAKYVARGLAGVTGTTAGKFDFVVHMGKSCSGAAGRHHGGTARGHGNGGGHQGHRSARGGHGEHQMHPTTGHTVHPTGGHEGHAGGTIHGGGEHQCKMQHARHRSGRHGRHSRDRARRDAPLAASSQVDITPPEDTTSAAIVGFALVVAIGSLGGWMIRRAV